MIIILKDNCGTHPLRIIEEGVPLDVQVMDLFEHARPRIEPGITYASYAICCGMVVVFDGHNVGLVYRYQPNDDGQLPNWVAGTTLTFTGEIAHFDDLEDDKLGRYYVTNSGEIKFYALN